MFNNKPQQPLVQLSLEESSMADRISRLTQLSTMLKSQQKLQSQHDETKQQLEKTVNDALAIVNSNKQLTAALKNANNEVVQLKNTFNQAATPTIAATVFTEKNEKYLKSMFKDFPPFVLAAQKSVIQRACANPSQIRHDPAPSRLFGGMNALSATNDETAKACLGEQIVLPVLVWNPEEHLPHGKNGSYNAHKTDVQEKMIEKLSYFKRLWCRKCGGKTPCLTDGRWHIRKGYDVDSAFLFVYKGFSCSKCDPPNNISKLNNELNGEVPYASPTADKSEEDEEEVKTLCKLDCFLDISCPEYVAALCPVILSKKGVFTIALRNETRETCLTKSNCHEFYTTLQRRYADTHLQRVKRYHQYALHHMKCSEQFYAHQREKYGDSVSIATHPFMPHVSAWQKWIGDFNDPRFASVLSRPLLPSPSDTYLRYTILHPHLSNMRNLLERYLEEIKMTQINALDSTYHAPGKAVDKNKTQRFRSSFELFNEIKQCVGLVFAESDSYACIEQFLKDCFKRLEKTPSFNPQIHPMYLYTDRCCMDILQLQKVFKTASPESKGVEVKLDAWHFFNRMFQNRNLRIVGGTNAAQHSYIFKDFRETILKPVNHPMFGEIKQVRPQGELVKSLDALMEKWKKMDLLKDIVATERFNHRWNLQMKHVAKGCLSDPPVDMYKKTTLENGNTKMMCKRGTNCVENFHKQMGSFVASSATMSPTSLGVLMNLMIYRHNYRQHCIWNNEIEIRHGDPLLLRENHILWRETHLFGGGTVVRVCENPFTSKFHDSQIGMALSVPSKLNFFEKYAQRHPQPSASLFVAIPSWPNGDRYLAEISISSFVARERAQGHNVPSTPVCLRLVPSSILPTPAPTSTSSPSSNMFITLPPPVTALRQTSSEDVAKCLTDALEKSDYKLSNELDTILSVPTHGFSSNELSKFFVGCCNLGVGEPPTQQLAPGDIDDTFLDLIEYRDGEPVGKFMSFEEWFEAFDSEFAAKETDKSFLNKIAQALQKIADLTTCPVVCFQTQIQQHSQELSLDAPFFVPADVDLVQGRAFPSKYIAVVLDYSNYQSAANFEREITLYAFGSVQCKFNAYETENRLQQNLTRALVNDNAGHPLRGVTTQQGVTPLLLRRGEDNAPPSTVAASASTRRATNLNADAANMSSSNLPPTSIQLLLVKSSEQAMTMKSTSEQTADYLKSQAGRAGFKFGFGSSSQAVNRNVNSFVSNIKLAGIHKQLGLQSSTAVSNSTNSSSVDDDSSDTNNTIINESSGNNNMVLDAPNNNDSDAALNSNTNSNSDRNNKKNTSMGDDDSDDDDDDDDDFDDEQIYSSLLQKIRLPEHNLDKSVVELVMNIVRGSKTLNELITNKKLKPSALQKQITGWTNVKPSVETFVGSIIEQLQNMIEQRVQEAAASPQKLRK